MFARYFAIAFVLGVVLVVVGVVVVLVRPDNPTVIGPPKELYEHANLLQQLQEHRAKKQWDGARAALEKLVALDRAEHGQTAESVAMRLTQLAEVQERKGDWLGALKSRTEIVKQWEHLKGKDHWRTGAARVLTDEARRMAMGTEKQNQAWQKGVETLNEASMLADERKFKKALETIETTERDLREALGRDGCLLSRVFDLSGRCNYYLHDYVGTRRAYEEALRIRRKALPADHPDIATSLNNLGVVLGNDDARKAHEEALAIRRKALPSDHPDIAQSLNNLGLTQRRLRDYEAARTAFEEALAIRKSNHPDYAGTLNNLGLVFLDLHEYKAARKAHEEALAIQRRVLPANHPKIAGMNINLGNALLGLQDYVAARKALEEALTIQRKALPSGHPDFAISLNSLGMVLFKLRDYVAARNAYEEALAIQRKDPRAGHQDIVITLTNLSSVLLAMRDSDAAQSASEEALAIQRVALPANHPDIARSLNMLGNALHLRNPAAAQHAYEEALAIRRTALPADHIDIAYCLNNLGLLHWHMHSYGAASKAHHEAFAIFRKILPANHPVIAGSLNNLGLSALAQSKPAESYPQFLIALSIWRAQLIRLAMSQDEIAQLAAVMADRSSLDLLMSASDENHASATYASVLDWKGQVTARARWQRIIRALSHDPHVASLAAELVKANGQIAHLASGMDQAGLAKASEYRARAEIAMTQRAGELETTLAQRSPEFHQMLDQRNRAIDPAHLGAVLPADAAVVDFLTYSHLQFVAGEPNTEERVIAFVLRPGRTVQQVNLGVAAPLEEQVATWRKTYSAGDLRRLLCEPLEKHLDGVKLVLVSPDGFLTGLPFAALPGKKDGEYLLHEYTFATIPIPSQLPELVADKSAKSPPSMLLMGDVDFDGNSPYRRLPGTRAEMDAIRTGFQKAFPDVSCEPLSEAKATKAEFVKSVATKRYLHLATHGYFAGEEVKNAFAARAQTSLLRGSFDDRRPVEGLPPGLLSGLVFAGANRGKQDDTRLTAMEVADMDLHADLVVLSACETGLGKVAGGEGVLGLQRAFQVAGAKSVLATLWSVDDDATQILIREFYHNLWVKKLSKVESLRHAQIRLLEDGKFTPGTERALRPAGSPPPKADRNSPYYWAGFVLSGDWR